MTSEALVLLVLVLLPVIVIEFGTTVYRTAKIFSYLEKAP